MSLASFESRFLTILAKVLPFVEPTVKAIQAGEASASQPGTTKQAIALTALTGLESVADVDLSQEDQATAAAVTGVLASTIDATVNDLKTQGTLAEAGAVSDTIVQAVANVTAAIAPPPAPAA